MNKNEQRALALAIVLVFTLVPSCMYGYPHYNIYKKKMAGRAGIHKQRLAGEASLKKEKWRKLIIIEEAKAKLESAKLRSQAEVERAKGVAEANKIIGESLKGNEGYLMDTGTSRWK